MTPLFALASVATSFCGVFARIFQAQNVQHHHKRLAFFTSYVVAALDVLTVGFIVHSGWLIALTSGTGAAFGVVSAMTVHRKLVKRHE